MHENELRNWTEGRYQPHQMLIRVLQKRLALGDGVHSYVLYHDQVYRRKYIEHRQPLVKGHPVMVPPGGNQYVCAHCGKPEDEHCNNSVRDRKNHVFKRLTVPMTDARSIMSDQNSGLVVQIPTPCYEPLMDENGRVFDLTDFLYKLTHESFSMWMSSTSKIQNIESVVKAVQQNQKSASRLKADPGVFGFEDGIWHAKECRWFPYICECHGYACPGRSHASDFTKGIFIQDNPERIEHDSDVNIAVLGLSLRVRKLGGFEPLWMMSMTSFATVNIPLRCTLPSKQSVSTAGQACGAISSQLNFSKVPIWTTRKSWLKWWVLSYQTMQITHVSSAEKKRDDSDHKPHCTDDEGNVCPFFLSNPEDPVKCIFCDNEVDAHEPVCKGHFIDPPSSETRPKQSKPAVQSQTE